MNGYNDIRAAMETIQRINNEDLLVKNDEGLIEVEEDYEGEAPYGGSKEEVIKNLFQKYLNIDLDEEQADEVTVNLAALKTAISDAFEAGVDPAVSKDEPVEAPVVESEEDKEGECTCEAGCDCDVPTKLTESVDSVSRDINSGMFRYEVDSDTGVISLSVVLDGVTGSIDILSQPIHTIVSDILTNSAYTSEVAIEKMNVFRSKISGVIQSFVESESFRGHVNSQLGAVLRAYAVSLESLIDNEITKD